MSAYRYYSYGISFQSQIFLPELQPTDRAPEVNIRYGNIDPGVSETNRSYFLARDNGCLIHLDKVGKFLIRHGREIVVEPAVGAENAAIRLLLLGRCFSVILHQRGILALHASAFRSTTGAVLLTGPAGCGKSTLLEAFMRKGYRMLADDVTGIAFGEDGVPEVLAAYPQTKLWMDSAEELGHRLSGMSRVRPEMDKFTRLTPEEFVAETCPLRAIYVLDPWQANTIEIHHLTNSAKFDVLLENTYRKPILDALGLRARHFSLAVAAANAAVVRRVRRPTSGFRLRELADAVEADFSGIAPRS